ncbi:MAG: hypothetical protein JJ926_10800 [Roseitalea sp.]|nr:hypothetical protein [Roseitalea sp.]MBO6952361.1 hypothetical protein [Rhizobiaceae bacterium]MBO6591793.1 hypothetical protein [Roseitalea sp.]MBO6598048.1 hypothetical protein [Roseitalea sp.]MBO6610494.1 hypothetical protein [Roseitalea sp.]
MATLTEWLAEIAASGRLAEIAMAVLLLELAVFLFVYRTPAARRTLIFNTLSGLALMAALRSALIGHGALAIAGFLSLGFVMHLAELWFRHRAFRRVSAPRPD